MSIAGLVRVYGCGGAACGAPARGCRGCLGACSVAVPVRRNDIGSEDAGAIAALGVVLPRLGRDVPRLVAAMEVAARGIGRSLPPRH